MENIKVGVVYPQTEFGNNLELIREYACLSESLGFNHILAYDHVLGANPNRPGGFQGPYTYQTPFMEPFVFFAYLAAVTKSIGLTTGVIILPQRQTALVAKQAATLDVLSQGRLRLGFGIGWNQVEYEALNENFHNRGRRMEEQIQVLRLLWTNPLVSFTGRWHHIPDAGLNPLPIQQPIPIWFGGHAEEALRRAARLGDGWMPNYRTTQEAAGALALLQQALEDNQRDPKTFGLEARLHYGKGNPSDWEAWIEDWRSVNVSHITLNTMGCGFHSPQNHLEAIEKFAKWMQGVR